MVIVDIRQPSHQVQFSHKRWVVFSLCGGTVTQVPSSPTSVRCSVSHQLYIFTRFMIKYKKSNNWYISTKLHSVTSQKTGIFIVTAIVAPDLITGEPSIQFILWQHYTHMKLTEITLFFIYVGCRTYIINFMSVRLLLSFRIFFSCKGTGLEFELMWLVECFYMRKANIFLILFFLSFLFLVDNSLIHWKLS